MDLTNKFYKPENHGGENCYLDTADLLKLANYWSEYCFDCRTLYRILKPRKLAYHLSNSKCICINNKNNKCITWRLIERDIPEYEMRDTRDGEAIRAASFVDRSTHLLNGKNTKGVWKELSRTKQLRSSWSGFRLQTS